MTNQELNERIGALESRQNELMATMAASDAHAAKCTKLGKPFAEAYTNEYAAYLAANAEYNKNESDLEFLRGLSGEEDENSAAG